MGVKFNSPLTRAALVLVFAAAAGLAEASVEYFLLNHPNGSARNQGGYYGLRLDYGSQAQTFSFQTNANSLSSDSTVRLRITPGPQGSGVGFGGGLISGTMIHNQSGQEWGISATLAVHTLNSDASQWYSPAAAPNLYNGVLSDLVRNGANLNGTSGYQLKDNPNLDKIVFNLVELEMTLNSGGTPAFDPTGSGATSLTYYDYPDGDPNGPPDPFVIAKGHRLNDNTDELVGIGWLGDDPDNPRRGATQDFLFRIGQPSMPEPTSALVWALSGLTVATVSARGRRS